MSYLIPRRTSEAVTNEMKVEACEGIMQSSSMLYLVVTTLLQTHKTRVISTPIKQLLSFFIVYTHDKLSSAIPTIKTMPDAALYCLLPRPSDATRGLHQLQRSYNIFKPVYQWSVKMGKLHTPAAKMRDKKLQFLALPPSSRTKSDQLHPHCTGLTR